MVFGHVPRFWGAFLVKISMIRFSSCTKEITKISTLIGQRSLKLRKLCHRNSMYTQVSGYLYINIKQPPPPPSPGGCLIIGNVHGKNNLWYIVCGCSFWIRLREICTSYDPVFLNNNFSGWLIN